MLLKIQKKLIGKFNFRQSKTLLLRSFSDVAMPMILTVFTFGIVMSIQTAPTKAGYTQSDNNNKSTGKYIITPAKRGSLVDATLPVTKPPVTTKQPNITAPSTVDKFAVTRAGTPKPEPVVTPAPSSSVSGLSPTTSTPPPSSPTPTTPQTSPTTSTPPPSSPTPTTPQTSPTTSTPPPSSPTPTIATGYLSTNWSGYLATDASFTSVSGTWIVTNAEGNNASISADSTWIGIGGVTSDDLIQTGTQNIISANGQVSTSAFYELLPVSSQPVPGILVSPGDSMTASIVEGSSDQWTITITDNTDEESSTVTVIYDSSLSSAEWIEEDPSYSSRRQIPFDNFNKASFTNALTIANGSTVNLTESTAQPVTMVSSDGQTIAEPSAIGTDGSSFNITP
jgi:hypothetical protein